MPFDTAPTGKLVSKLSTQIDGQLPDFIQSDHPLFSIFLKQYYQFLEAGELRVTVTIDNVIQEVETLSYILDEDGNRIVLDKGAGSAGKFTEGEIITGGARKAKATILVDDLGNTSTPRLFITSQQKFETGETITGAISGASGIVKRYRANPVQNIQQLLEYANVDNTIFDFLNSFRDEFMNAIPLTLADGVDKRNLIKNIRELYRAKGTQEAHKIFMTLLLGETPEVVYPNKFMMRASDGKWSNKIIMRCSPNANSIGSEVVGQTLTGLSSGATAIIASASDFAEGGAGIVEFELNEDSLSTEFTFTDGEIVQAVSTVQDFNMSFTVRQIVESGVVTDRGALYSVGDPVTFYTNINIGNGLAEAKVDNVLSGSVSDVVIDDAGTKFEVGERLTFTTSDSNTATASGFVSIIDGSLVLDRTANPENSRIDPDAGDFIISEEGTTQQVEFFEVALETATDNATGNLILDGTDSSSTNVGHNISMEASINQVTDDAYSTGSDRFALEEGTDSSGAISRVFVENGGLGYNRLPTVGVTTTTGTGAALLAVTDDIGRVGDVNITNQGFNYSQAPDMTFNASFTLVDVSGTFALNNTLTTHTGIVQAFNSSTNVLKTTLEDVIRVTLETGDSEGILLEDFLREPDGIKNTTVGLDRTIEVEDDIITEAGDKIVLDAEEVRAEFISLEDGTGETAGSVIVQEDDTEDTFFPPLQLELAARDGTNVGDGILNEDGVDIMVSETAVGLGDNSGSDRQLSRLFIEDNNFFIFTPLRPQLSRVVFRRPVLPVAADLIGPDRCILPDPFIFIDLDKKRKEDFIKQNSINAGDNLITDAVEDIEPSTLILDRTDSTDADAGDDVLNEEFGERNNIVLDGTDSDGSDAGARLLQDIETADGNVALNGTDSSQTNAGDNIINEERIDFFDLATGINPFPTTITDSSGATGKIAKVNIARGTSTIDTTMETSKTYGLNIESLIGEDLNRIQDSFFYQQFSYELQSGFGTNSYLDQLKKAVHPAGFAVFGKVKIASSVSAAVQDAGSSLGGGYFSNLNVLAPDDKFSPILASTFEILFDENNQFRTKAIDFAVGDLKNEIILEEAEDVGVDGDSIILDGTDASSTNAGSFIIEETPVFHFEDFAFIQIEDATDTDVGGAGVIVLNGTDSSSTNANDRIVSEKSIAVTLNVTLDRTEDSGTDADGDVLLDGTDSSGTDSGSSLELEDASSGIFFNRIGLQPNRNLATLLNENGGTQQLETSGSGLAENTDRSVVSFVRTRINLPEIVSNPLTTGLISFAKVPFVAQHSRFELEKGTATSGLLLIDNAETVFDTPVGGATGTTDAEARDPVLHSAGDNFILENGSDPNFGSQLTFESLGGYTVDTFVLNGTDSSSSNADDNILLETGGTLLLESVQTHNFFSIEDVIRPSRLLVADQSEDIGNVVLEGSTFGGSMMLENETTAPESHGDNILLETKTVFGVDNKILLETDKIVLEDNINSGVIPTVNFSNSTVEPLTRPSDVMISEYGAFDLEDGLAFGALLLNGTDGSSSNAGERIRFEIATEDNINKNYPPV